MSKDDQVPATKHDSRMLMDEIGKLYDANARWKDDIREEIRDSEERTKRHFDVTVETIRHDLTGANHDRIENHEDRIVRLERHAKLRAA